MSRILVLGATSAIAKSFVRQWLSQEIKKGRTEIECVLLGRQIDRLNTLTNDLRERGATKVTKYAFDVTELKDMENSLTSALQEAGDIDIALIAFGTLPDQQHCQDDTEYAANQFTLNATATITAMTIIANYLQKQAFGNLAVISSVAGDRGRASNGLYGSAKAAVSCYASAMRARLFAAGVHVTDVRPGFTASPMTAKLKLPSLLVSSPNTVARTMLRGISRGKPVVYAPWFWRWIMFGIKILPEKIFKRLNL